MSRKIAKRKLKISKQSKCFKKFQKSRILRNFKQKCRISGNLWKKISKYQKLPKKSECREIQPRANQKIQKFPEKN